MKIGVSTGCLFPMLTEDALKTLVYNGFDTFEIFFNTFSELEEDYLVRLKYFLDKHNARVSSVHPFTSSYESSLFFSAYERRFYDGLSFYEMYFRTAKFLGADKVILHGAKCDIPSNVSDKEYYRRFDMIQQRANEYGVWLLQENVYNFRSNRIEFVKNMIDEIPQSAAFVCDLKQLHMAEIPYEDMIRTMGKHLRHIHISDYSQGNKCLLPGKGEYDFKNFFRLLYDLGFDDDIIIEVYRFSYNTLKELCESKEYLENKQEG